MHTTSKLVLAAAGFLLTHSLSTVAQAQDYLDDFKTSYTGWSYLSTTQAGPYLWAGDSLAISTNTGEQSLTVAGIANARFAALQANTVAGSPVGDLGSYVGVTDWSTFDPNRSGPVGYLSFWSDLTGPSGILTLEYGPRSSPTALLPDLNLNLNPYTSLAFTLDGDLDDSTPHRPMVVTITLRSGTLSASHSWTICNDGVHQLAFNSFTFPPGFDKTSVDYIKVQFDASSVSAIDYDLVDGLRLSTVSSPHANTCI